MGGNYVIDDIFQFFLTISHIILFLKILYWQHFCILLFSNYIITYKIITKKHKITTLYEYYFWINDIKKWLFWFLEYIFDQNIHSKKNRNNAIVSLFSKFLIKRSFFYFYFLHHCMPEHPSGSITTVFHRSTRSIADSHTDRISPITATDSSIYEFSGSSGLGIDSWYIESVVDREGITSVTIDHQDTSDSIQRFAVLTTKSWQIPLPFIPVWVPLSRRESMTLSKNWSHLREIHGCDRFRPQCQG